MPSFDMLLLFIKMGIASLGVMLIVLGALRAVMQLYASVVHNSLNASTIRLDFGNNVILGLEFIVAADIVGSLIQPNYYNVGLLAILVLIRTILSYFLSLELSALTPQEKKSLTTTT